MNYKILAVSAAIGVGVITVSLMEAQTPARQRKVVERMTAVDVEAPQAEFGFMEASASNYPAAPRAPSYSVRAPEPAESRVGDGGADTISTPPAEIPVGIPQIAYLFSYGFRVPGAKIAALQQRHADLCESKGPLLCRIIAMEQTDGDGADPGGTLLLAVASGEARAFGKQLTTLAESSDGEQVSAGISGEDLSKRIVDTEARLRARTLLRDRLMEVLATRRGTVTELVEAERGVAQVNEEIDQARSWLAEMKNRVAYSRLDITYESSLPPSGGGFMQPVRGAVGSLGTLFGTLLAVLIVLGSLALPAMAAWLGLRALWRRSGWRWPTPVESVEA
jgi:hypothetical protein